MAGKHAADNPDPPAKHTEVPPKARKELSKAVKDAKTNKEKGGKS
jgi:hypothetical protein